MRIGLAVLSLLWLPVVAGAESPIDGPWVQVTDGAARPIQMQLTTDGSAVTGSIIHPEGFESSIVDGTFTGNTLEFKTLHHSGEETLTANCIGSVVAESISFSCTAEGQSPIDFVVSRPK